MESAIEELKKANAGTDVAAINAAMESLTKAQHTAAESLYKQAQSGPAGGGGGGHQGGGAAFCRRWRVAVVWRETGGRDRR